MNDGFLKAKNNEKMKFYLMWAIHDVKRIWDKRGADDVFTGKDNTIVWRAELDRDEFEKVALRWVEKYFPRPNYYKIDDKPVLMIYRLDDLIQGLGGIEETVDALEWFRQQVKKAGHRGLELQYSLRLNGKRQIIIDGEDMGEEKDLVEKLGIDSLTHYVYPQMTGVNRDYNEVVADVEKLWN